MEKYFLLLASILICQSFITVDADIKYLHQGCDGRNFNYTSGSVYENNLGLLFDKLISKSSTLKFYNSTLGNAPNNVYGLFLCRDDVSLGVCNECIKDAAQQIIKDCPLYGAAATWYYECTLWYSEQNILSGYETYPLWYTSKLTNISDYAVLASTLNGLIKNASSSPQHFASGKTKLDLFHQLLSFAECTPNIDTSGCNDCLQYAKSEMISYANGSESVMIFLPSCQLRYHMTNSTLNVQKPPASPPANDQGHGKGKKSSINLAIIGAIGGGVFAVLLIAVVLWICLCRKKPKEVINDVPRSTGTWTPEVKSGAKSLPHAEYFNYDFATLNTATKNFSPENKLGEGGFGAVYKGTLENGELLAIKRLSGTSGQGAKEFMTEARLLVKLQHRNLVKLMGFCSEGEEKLLVYEFMPNRSLNDFLFDASKRPLLDWEIRKIIIMGMARGLQYLHEDSRLTIIHRDLKPGNILLDDNMNPKISDFGMAKLFETAQRIGNTSRIAGTLGYMSPEYMTTGEYSDKSDVYSYGIILLEILSGKSNKKFYQLYQTEDLPVHAWKLWNERRIFDLTDPILINNSSSNDVIRCIHIGLLCLQSNAEHRPSMALVVAMLTTNVDLPLPSTPAMSFPQFNMPMNYSQENNIDLYSPKSITIPSNTNQGLHPKPR